VAPKICGDRPQLGDEVLANLIDVEGVAAVGRALSQRRHQLERTQQVVLREEPRMLIPNRLLNSNRYAKEE